MTNFETVAKGDSNSGSLDCESGNLPLSYRAPSHQHELAVKNNMHGFYQSDTLSWMK